jgi:hypothetical protein
MKKIFLLIIAAGLSLSGWAQFTYGPKLGVNMAKFSGEKIMPGAQAGMFLNGELWDRLGVQVDFLWTMKGSKSEKTDTLTTVTTNTMTGTVTTTTSTATATRTAYYRFVDIPICAYFPISDHIRGFFGPQLSIFRGGKQKATSGGQSSESDITGVTGEMSWTGGFDFQFNSPIILGVRFASNKFTKGTQTSGTADKDAKQSLNAVMISLAYRMSW